MGGRYSSCTASAERVEPGRGRLASFEAAGFIPMAPDLPGYGGRPAVTKLDFEGLAEDVETFIAESRVHRPVLVGHSMGGMVAQTMLRRRPDGYSAAVLACTSPAFGNADGDFQRKFVADRLGPLDAGKTMADLAPRLVDAHDGAAARPGRARARNRSHGRSAGRHLPRGGALPRRLRRACQPGAASAFPCCAWPARQTPTPRRR